MRRLLGLTPLAATVTAALVLVGLATAPSMFLTLLGPAEIHSLVEGEQSFPMTMTTYTTETLPERQLCTLHTYGKDYSVKFQLANTTGQLAPYFDNLTVLVKLAGDGWSRETTTRYTGSAVTRGSITVSPDVAVYACNVTVTYSSKGTAGTIRIGLNIWAEG